MVTGRILVIFSGSFVSQINAGQGIHSPQFYDGLPGLSIEIVLGHTGSVTIMAS